MSFLSKVLKGVAGVVAAPFTAGASLGLTADSVLGAGTQLLGGFLDRRANADAIAGQNAYNDPAAVRARAEAAGFNPLLFVGPNVGQQNATGSAYMGSAIADAGMILADGMSRKRESQKLSALQQQNQKLQDHIQSLTLRPKVGGIYAQRQATPTAGQALGASNAKSSLASVSSPAVANASAVGSASSSSGGAEPLRPLADNLPVDRRRDVKNDELKTHAGFMVVDNPNAPFPIYVPTLDGDEALQWYDYPSLVLPVAISAGMSLYHGTKQGSSVVGLRPTDWRQQRNKGLIPWELSYDDWLKSRKGGKPPYTYNQLALP